MTKFIEKESLPDLDANRRCPKCGSKEARVIWCSEDDCTRYGHKIPIYFEHIHRYCSCGFQWVEKTLEQMVEIYGK